MNCPEEYIGESGGAFEDKLKENLGPHPPSTTIATPQDTWSALNVLPLMTGTHRES